MRPYRGEGRGQGAAHRWAGGTHRARSEPRRSNGVRCTTQINWQHGFSAPNAARLVDGGAAHAKPRLQLFHARLVALHVEPQRRADLVGGGAAGACTWVDGRAKLGLRWEGGGEQPCATSRPPLPAMFRPGGLWAKVHHTHVSWVCMHTERQWVSHSGGRGGSPKARRGADLPAATSMRSSWRSMDSSATWPGRGKGVSNQLKEVDRRLGFSGGLASTSRAHKPAGGAAGGSCGSYQPGQQREGPLGRPSPTWRPMASPPAPSPPPSSSSLASESDPSSFQGLSSLMHLQAGKGESGTKRSRE